MPAAHVTWPPRHSALAGLVGSAVTTGALAVLHTLVRSVPFLPESLAQWVVRTAPGGLATYLIDRLGRLALRLAVAGTFAAFLVAGAALGLLAPALLARARLSPGRGALVLAGMAAFVPFWAASVALYPSSPQSFGRWMVAPIILPVYLLGGGVGGWSLARLRSEPPSSGRELSRRYFLRALWLGGLGVVLGASDLGRLIYRRPDPGLEVLRIKDLVRAATAPPPSAGDASFRGVPGLTPRLTSNDSFYVVDEQIIDPDVDPALWRLSVGGRVNRPLVLSYDQLTALPVVERYQTLECISNPVGGDLISCAKWAGVALAEVLDRAGARPGSVEVVFRCAGGYSESLSIEQAMDEQTLLAIGMNDRVLPRAHGFPVRVLSVGNYGMKNPKWVTSIEVVDRPYSGYWVQRGWSKSAIVRTGSRIDTPLDGSEARGVTTVAGIAFGGDRGIPKVEVSTDGGGTWTPAQLETALSPVTWRRWLYRWPVSGAGRADVLARATDGTGAVQVKAVTPPHPSGATGYDGVTVIRGS